MVEIGFGGRVEGVMVWGCCEVIGGLRSWWGV